MVSAGVKTLSILGGPVRLTSPARTVVDCFRYRRKLGLDVALEALRDAVRSRTATVAQIARAAEACRAGTVIRPYSRQWLRDDPVASERRRLGVRSPRQPAPGR